MQQKMKKWNQALNKLITKKNVLIITILITILLLVPVLWVSFYTVPSADDFSYGKETMNVLQTEGIGKVVTGSFKTLNEFYHTWQGTYSAIILFSLNPGILGKNAYFLTTFLVLGIFFLSLAYLLKQLLIKALKLDKKSYWIVLLLFFLLCMETLVDKTQGLYWWNGASYYIIFFSLELLEFALLIKQYWLKEKTKTNTIILLLLIGIIGGGNFIIALQQVIILFFLNIYLLIIKKDKSALPYLAISILGLGISATAPGNKFRQKNVTGMNPVKAIILSFYFCLKFMTEWTNAINIIVILIIGYLLYPTYKKVEKKYSYPLIVVLFMYCILSAEFTPTLYSMSSTGEGRLLNIIYFSYLFFMVISLYYIVGYFRNVLKTNKITTKNAAELGNKYIKDNSFLLLGTVLMVLGLALYYGREDLTSYQTLALLRTNEHKTYQKEWLERYKVLEDDSIKDVTFKPLTYYPYPIYYCDFSEDRDNWLNEPATIIYHKNYIEIEGKEDKNGKHKKKNH